MKGNGNTWLSAFGCHKTRISIVVIKHELEIQLKFILHPPSSHDVSMILIHIQWLPAVEKGWSGETIKMMCEVVSDTHSIAAQCSMLFVSMLPWIPDRISLAGWKFFEILWVLKLWWSPLPLWHSPRTWANFTSFSRSLVRCAMRVLGYTLFSFSRWRNADSSRKIIFIWQLGRKDREHTKWNGSLFARQPLWNGWKLNFKRHSVRILDPSAASTNSTPTVRVRERYQLTSNCRQLSPAPYGTHRTLPAHKFW